MKIGWIGTGKMGMRMSTRLVRAGYDVCVFDISRANAEPVVQAGAAFMDSAAELAACSDVMFTMIPNSKILRSIVTGSDGVAAAMRPESVLVDMSTIDPAGSAAVCQEIENRSGIFLRAPVTGSLANAEKGDLGVMCSGNRDAYERLLPVFQALSTRQYYVGQSDEARYLKIAVNMLVGGIIQLLAESLVVGESAGLDWNTMIDVIANSAAAAPIIKFKAEALKQRDFSPMGTSDFVLKDLDIALKIAEEKALSLPVTSLSRQYYAAMHRMGRGDLDYAAVLMLNEEMNGIEHV